MVVIVGCLYWGTSRAKEDLGDLPAAHPLPPTRSRSSNGGRILEMLIDDPVEFSYSFCK